MLQKITSDPYATERGASLHRGSSRALHLILSLIRSEKKFEEERE